MRKDLFLPRVFVSGGRRLRRCEKDVGEQALEGVPKIKLKHVTQRGQPSQDPSKQLEPRN